MGIFL